MEFSTNGATTAASLVLIGVLAVACSDPSESGGNGITPGRDTSVDTTRDSSDVAPTDSETEPPNDTELDGQTGGACVGVTCDSGQECMDGECVPVGTADACEIPRDLGVLRADGSTTTVELALDGRTDSLQTSCGAAGAPEGAIRFRTEDAARIELGASSDVGIAYEIRTANCENADSALTCQTDDSHIFYTAAGLDYFLILEPTDAAQLAPVEVTLTASESACAPPGASTCEGANREICFADDGIQSRACADVCNDGYCAGDTCSDLISVSGSASFSGDSDAYRNRFDFSGEASCASDGAQGSSSPGYDIAFEMTGLTAGQSVSVDASNTNAENYIFVLADCSQTGPCLTARGAGSDLSNWTVPADGNYFVVVDQAERTEVPFQIDIDIQ